MTARDGQLLIRFQALWYKLETRHGDCPLREPWANKGGRCMSKKKSAALGVAAIVTGIVALPVAAFVNWVAGLALLSVPVFLIYKAS